MPESHNFFLTQFYWFLESGHGKIPSSTRYFMVATYFSIVFFAKKNANRSFSNFFVNSKFDILKVIPKSLPNLWSIKEIL